MGVDYRGVICVGYTYDELGKLSGFFESDGDCYEFCEESGLESYAPCFDDDAVNCIYGVVIAASPDYFHTEVSNLDEPIEKAIEDMTKKFGAVPKAYLMARGW